MADRGSPPAPERRYRDDEAWAILERATSRDRNRDLPEPHDATLADLMASRGMADRVIGKVLGGNFARLFGEVWT